MRTNDFAAVALRPAEDVVIDWPLSGERICVRANFVATNATYPATGRRFFREEAILAGGGRAVTDMILCDGAQTARATTFHKVRGGRIVCQRECWPEPYAAPSWRAKWVERT